ncbi:hypothetical protein DFH07DRAFT_340497 [Mycena maculata]|uniref:Uncharacterized protein n=1 Tax=Mycena maculata TaxID=230809 RepID=A0AAD7HCV5_9AGAR|nr:hypothetical protein DFH07DRAFT_340497 [Mycena maculata]
MPVSSTVSLPLPPQRNGDSLRLHIPEPPAYSPSPNASLPPEFLERKTRPLPSPPNKNLASPRPTPRRRASGGFFVYPPPPRTERFYICNPGNSPLSPDQPQLPSPLAVRPSLHITPPTPLPPPTPAVFRSHINLVSPVLAPTRPDEHVPPSGEPLPKVRPVHRRFGASVGSVPDSALAELRRMGLREGNAPARSPTLPTFSGGGDSDSDTSSDEDDAALEEEEYSWVVTEVARGVRPKDRNSLKWVQDLGEDRWVADRYSSILRAL